MWPTSLLLRHIHFRKAYTTDSTHAATPSSTISYGNDIDEAIGICFKYIYRENHITLNCLPNAYAFPSNYTHTHIHTHTHASSHAEFVQTFLLYSKRCRFHPTRATPSLWVAVHSGSFDFFTMFRRLRHWHLYGTHHICIYTLRCDGTKSWSMYRRETVCQWLWVANGLWWFSLT